MKHGEGTRAYRIAVIVLAALLLVTSVWAGGAEISRRKRQAETDRDFLLAYGELLLCLMDLTLGEEGAFSESAIHWSAATEAGATARALCRYTTFCGENPALASLLDALYLCAARGGGFGLRMDNALYQRLKDTSAYFGDEEATLELVDLVQERTVRIEAGIVD